MAFLSTFSGLIAALLIWVGLYTLATEVHVPLLNALAPYLEALSPVGEGLFVILAVIFSLLIYRLLKPRAGQWTLGTRQRLEGRVAPPVERLLRLWNRRTRPLGTSCGTVQFRAVLITVAPACAQCL